MDITKTDIEDVLIIEPKVFQDSRGFFQEIWNQKKFDSVIGEKTLFVQDNYSRSSKNVLRGLHFQNPRPQGKLVKVVTGNILDVVVDLRINSKTFGNHVTVEISSENHKQIWAPAGCAHGFFVLSDLADVLYKTTDFYFPEYERCIQWDDPDLAIDWRLNNSEPRLSEKDKHANNFKDVECYS